LTHCIALLTGAGGGLGSCTATYLHDRGWHVFATDVDDDSLAALAGVDGITPLHMDVTDQASITAVFQQVEGMTAGLDGLVNLAGTIAMGSVVEMDEATLVRVLNVNALGCYRVNRTFFPLVLQRHGRIVNISSEVGWQRGAPFIGAYGMSKHMVEAYSDSLRRELMLLDVPVIKVQPGPIKTEMTRGLAATMDRAIDASTHFKGVLTRMKGLVVKEYDTAHDPIVVAQAVYEALTAARPRLRYSVRPPLQRVLLEKLPVRWADALMKRLLSG
jgi:NAD(P)-dependent dehydrogenase (short-subunit alcohol dehydrogenase family)